MLGLQCACTCMHLCMCVFWLLWLFHRWTHKREVESGSQFINLGICLNHSVFSNCFDVFHHLHWLFGCVFSNNFNKSWWIFSGNLVSHSFHNLCLTFIDLESICLKFTSDAASSLIFARNMCYPIVGYLTAVNSSQERRKKNAKLWQRE